MELATKQLDKPAEGFWDGWIFTDEMYLVVGENNGVKTAPGQCEESFQFELFELQLDQFSSVQFAKS